MAERTLDTGHLILFDGNCGFCRRAVGFISGADSSRVFRFSPLMSDDGLRAVEGSAIDTGTFGSLLVVPSGNVTDRAPLQKAAAVLFIIRRLDWPWRLASVARVLPLRLLDWAYDQVARNRYLLTKDDQACDVPELAKPDPGSPH